MPKIAILVMATLLAFSINASDVQVNAVVVDRLECAEDCKRQYEKLRRFARNGSPRAQTLLGLIHRTGEFDQEQDADEAWRWMKRAKLQRYPPAMYYLSEWYREGYRNEVDIERANDYLQRAADRGYVPAIFQLGMRQMEENQYEEGMALVNVAIKANYPPATKFNDMLTKAFEAQADTSEDGTIVLSADTMANESPGSFTSVAQDTDERLVIYGSKEDPQLLMVNLMQELEGIALYNSKGFTGSRLGDLKCGQAGSGCQLVKFEDGFSYDTFLRNVFGLR